ncbi:sigma-70 family RNA polymerase sigma factor [Amycolatopsis sp. NPDC004625]|uniref:RNA polymerase sigma factor n=1 Tax=Amycolatopsis sp. NPDC004625 TaxID=3154670 RepID=UPI0033B930DA
MTQMESPGPPSSAPLVESYEAFYRATADRTFRAVLRIAAGDRDVAQDATQEAYCQMLRLWSLRRNRSIEDNRKYVLGIASKKVIDVFRGRRKLTELDDEMEVCAEDAQLAAVLDRATVIKTVLEVIVRQPAQRRAVAVLFFIEDLTDEEVASALTMNRSTVRTHIQRARSVLKLQLDQYEQGGEGV